jgi:hypothetical protein
MGDDDDNTIKWDDVVRLWPDEHGGFHRTIWEAQEADMKWAAWEGHYDSRERMRPKPEPSGSGKSDDWAAFVFLTGLFPTVIFPLFIFGWNGPITIGIIWVVLGVIAIIGATISKWAYALGTLTVIIEFIIAFFSLPPLTPGSPSPSLTFFHLPMSFFTITLVLYIVPLSVEWITIFILKKI